MYNLINNRALSALMISSIALTTVACANQGDSDENSLPEPAITAQNSTESNKGSKGSTSHNDHGNNDTSTNKKNSSLSNPDRSIDTHFSSEGYGDVSSLPYVGFSDHTSNTKKYDTPPSSPSVRATHGLSLPLLNSSSPSPSLKTGDFVLPDVQSPLYNNDKEKSNRAENKENTQVDGKFIEHETHGKVQNHDVQTETTTGTAGIYDDLTVEIPPAKNDTPTVENHEKEEGIKDTATSPIESLENYVENTPGQDIAIEIPKVDSEDDFSQIYAQWLEQKNKAKSRLDDADKAVLDATANLNKESDRHQLLVDRVNQAQADYDKANREYDEAVKNLQHEQIQNEAMLRDTLKTAKDALSQAKVDEANAKTALLKAQEDMSRVQADRSKKVAKLEAIETGIASLDKRIEANNTEKAELESQKTPSARTDFTTDEYQILVAQAVIEMVNAYRIENGVAPLRTHDVFNYSAQAWSEQMARDGKNVPASEFGDAFRHSPKTWGASGENIAGMYMGSPEQLEKRDWAYIPGELFELWRNSPAHNEAMLGVQAQGVGVGVVVDEHGRVWATTQFFKEDTQFTSGAHVRMDKGTEQALKSGKDFYVVEGAMDVLGTDWHAPTHTNGADVSYQYIKDGRASQEAKVRGLSHGVDDAVALDTGLVSNDVRARIDGRIAQLDADNAAFSQQRQDAVKKKEDVASEIDAIDHAQQLAGERVALAEAGVIAAGEKVAQSESDVSSAQAAIDSSVASSGVSPDLKVARDAAEINLTAVQNELAESEVAVSQAQDELTDAMISRSEAQASFDDVMGSEPVEVDETVAEVTVETGIQEEAEYSSDDLSFDDVD